MQPRTLQQIQDELAQTYDPQVNSIRQQQAAIPQSVEANIATARGEQTRAYDDIFKGAHRRGLTYSGVPLGEQAKYNADVFSPRVLQFQREGQQQVRSLEDAILGINERRNTAAFGIRQNEQSLAEQQRQFNENLAFQKQQQAAQQRAAGAGNSWVKALQGGGQQAAAPKAQMGRKQDGGFAFADQGGQPISAAKYAQLNGQDIRDVLYQMGQAGDSYSQQLYNQFASDKFFGKGNAAYDKKVMQTYSPIFWGMF